MEQAGRTKVERRAVSSRNLCVFKETHAHTQAHVHTPGVCIVQADEYTDFEFADSIASEN